MTLHLTPDILAASYEFNRALPPFCDWRLPDADDIEFRVVADRNLVGYHQQPKGKNPIIGISLHYVGRALTLNRTMSHEMIHLRQAITKTATPNAEHNAEFKRLAKLVCRIHGYDPKEF